MSGPKTVSLSVQAEDGIRDWSVTGVQTCALPIYVMPFPGKDIVDCWGGEASGGGNLILCVERVHAEFSPQHLRQADLPSAQQLTTVKWKDYDVDAPKTGTNIGPGTARIYAAPLPLVSEAS